MDTRRPLSQSQAHLLPGLAFALGALSLLGRLPPRRPAVGATEPFSPGQAVSGCGAAWAGSCRHSRCGLSQVSHHPPSAAHHVFSKNGWSLWQEITISSKFRGKYLSIMPLGERGLSPRQTFWRREVSPRPEASVEPPGLPCRKAPCPCVPSHLCEHSSRDPGIVGPSMGSHDL